MAGLTDTSNIDKEEECIQSLEKNVDASNAKKGIDDEEKYGPLDIPLYKYISNVSESNQALSEISEYVLENHRIAVDLEGNNLSRSGTITLVAVGTPSMAYLFDIIGLGRKVFDSGLRGILEDKKIDKLMFDCREDSDALWHLFDVNIDGVVDVQLLEVIRSSDGKHTKSHNDIERLESLITCIYHYLKDTDIVKSKQGVAKKIQSSKAIWEERPIPHDLLVYAAYDVKTLFALYDTLEPDEDDMNRLRLASGEYCKTKRSMVMRRYNEYERNPYLPINIIPPKGSAFIPPGNTKCTGCLRLFPYDEFTKTQLRKRIQLCRVCKLIKSHKDGQSAYIPSRLGTVPTILNMKKETASSTDLNEKQNENVTPRAEYLRYYDSDRDWRRYYDSDSDSEFRYGEDDSYEDNRDYFEGITYECGLREMDGGFDTGSGEWRFSYE